VNNQLFLNRVASNSGNPLRVRVLPYNRPAGRSDWVSPQRESYAAASSGFLRLTNRLTSDAKPPPQPVPPSPMAEAIWGAVVKEAKAEYTKLQ